MRILGIACIVSMLALGFVSSTQVGADMSPDAFTQVVLPRLLSARIERVTLTGGEPFVHPDLLAMCRVVVDQQRQAVAALPGFWPPPSRRSHF